MKQRATAWAALAGVALLTAAGLLWPARKSPESGALTPVPLATPPGITLQTLPKSNPTAPGSAPDIVYADANGMTLYTYDKDDGHGPNCTGACATAWPPALAPAEANATDDWSVIVRADGTRQWAHRGRPLYRAAGTDGADAASFHAVIFRPGADLPLPADVVVRDLAAGGGIGLADPAGITLYVFAAAATDRKTSRHWLPLEAPAVANPVGDFSVIARDDGITQWAWRGQPLYRFDEDQNAGDFNGASVDARFRVALLLRHFTPADVALRRTAELGYYFSTADGATLYAHDRAPQTEVPKIIGAHRGSPATGRALGTMSCDAACSRDWKPFLAPARAAPSGYWDIATRSDGARQWAYKGFALYTYAADRPGQARGHGLHELVQIGDARADELATGRNTATTVGLGIGALYWHAVAP
jgi:predicted lipoprotein with Yx(FWY)xxD motif